MSEDTKQPLIQPGRKKLSYRKKWRPDQFAKYLMSFDMKYVLPGTSDEVIMKEVPNLHCGINKVNWLRNHKEFQKAVEEVFNDKIRSNFSAETMFYIYLKHCFEKNMQSEKPSEKLIDILGHLSGKYTPKLPKPKKGEPLTAAQAAKMIHEREQAKARLEEKRGIKEMDKEGGVKDG